MVKVVGTVLRHTLGFENQFGTGRRSHAALSYIYIGRFANVTDLKTLSATLKNAISKHYIQCVSEGRFDPNTGKESRSATYVVNWLP